MQNQSDVPARAPKELELLSPPPPCDPVWQALDQYQRDRFEELLWEADTEDSWEAWTDASRATWYLWQQEDDGLPRVERLKLELWRLLGGFAVDEQHPLTDFPDSVFDLT